MNAFRNLSNGISFFFYSSFTSKNRCVSQDDSNFSTICLKNVEFNLNKTNLSIDKLFESSDLTLIGLALSLYCDVIRWN